MKYLFLLFLELICLHNLKGNDLQVIENEFWTYSEGSPIALRFYNYYFYEDGSFEYHYGYSGGGYYSDHIFGKFYYNFNEDVIELEVIRSDIYPTHFYEHYIPSNIFIMELLDNTVKIKMDNNENVIIMERRVGITSDQYWYKGKHSSGDCFSFSRNARIEIRINGIEYFGEYSIINNILFLKINSKRDRTNYYYPGRTEVFDSEIRLYIRVNLMEEVVLIERIDIEEIINMGRDWIYENGHYIIIGKIIESNIVWEEYNRRRME